jgi:mono/diheme cytochrome c family protein
VAARSYPAHPTTYASSPVGYTTKAIAAGAALYASNCSPVTVLTDAATDPAAASPWHRLATCPNESATEAGRSLLVDCTRHSGHGDAGFAPRLTDVEIWSVIHSSMRNPRRATPSRWASA